MFHMYGMCIQCQGHLAMSEHLMVFAAEISSHSYQRALSPTAPVHSPTDETMPTTVRRPGRDTLNRQGSLAAQEQLMPCLHPSCVYHV